MVYYIFGAVALLWVASLKYYAMHNDIPVSKTTDTHKEQSLPVPWRKLFSKPAIW